MYQNAGREVDYRLAKWVIRNMEKEQLLTPDEIKAIWTELLTFYSPPNRCIENVGETIMACGRDDSLRILFKRRIWCGVCGNYFTFRTWHNTDWVWACSERYRIGHACSNAHFYEYAFDYAVKRIMLALIAERNDGVKRACSKTIRTHLDDEDRLRCALHYLRGFENTHPDNLDLGDEPAFLIERITVYPDGLLETRIIDESTVNYRLTRYTPILGWRKEGPRPIIEKPRKKQTTEGKAKRMTSEQIKVVDVLRREGNGYKRIANMLGININTIKSHCRRHPVPEAPQEPDEWVAVRSCKYCGGDVAQTRGRKEKIFCSDQCRVAWWNVNANQADRKAMYDYECAACGKPFRAYGNRNRKYCSHECYLNGRFVMGL